jgi:hypothetical protein
VLFSLLTVAGLIAVAAPCLGLATHLFFPRELSQMGSDLAPQKATRPSSRGLRFGAALAGLLLVLGFFPNWGMTLAARVTFQRPVAGPLAAEQQSHSLKKHRRARAADDSE